MKNQIMDLLQWSSAVYDERVFQAYWTWCQANSKFPLTDHHLPSIEQQLLANGPVNKWFMDQYYKCELKFLEIANIVGNKNINELEGHYKACTADIMRFYPKALMEGLHNNRDFQSRIIYNTPDVLLN